MTIGPTDDDILDMTGDERAPVSARVSDRRIRLVEANVDLCINYVREIAKSHLTKKQIDELELAHQQNLADIARDTSDG